MAFYDLLGDHKNHVNNNNDHVMMEKTDEKERNKGVCMCVYVCVVVYVCECMSV